MSTSPGILILRYGHMSEPKEGSLIAMLMKLEKHNFHPPENYSGALQRKTLTPLFPLAKDPEATLTSRASSHSLIS